MYRIATVEDKIRVPPEKLDKDVKNAIKSAIADQLESFVNSRIGVVLSVLSIDKVGEGRIVPNDPGVYYNCEFRLLTYKPEMNELVFGRVVDNTEFGSFVRMGPMDGLIHISQLMDDFVSFDNKNSVFLGKESKRILKEGDMVCARVISVNLKRGENKIGLTMRQPGLGAISWIKDEKKRRVAGVSKPRSEATATGKAEKKAAKETKAKKEK